MKRQTKIKLTEKVSIFVFSLLFSVSAYADMRILYAGYGVWNSTFNVTAKVRSQYESGQRHFTANNRDYGDPSPGARKYLYIIWQADGGRVASGVVGEYDFPPVGINLP